YLSGKDAEVAACDAIIDPVVVGHPDLTVVDQMIDIVLAFLDGTEDEAGGRDEEAVSDSEDSAGPGPAGDPGDAAPRTRDSSRDRSATERARLLSPEAWQALRYAMARLAVELCSGPAGIAATLRRGLLDAPYNSTSIPLDIGYSATIPGHIR